MPTIDLWTEQWTNFMEAIARVESGNNYHAINRRGFLGRYQFGEALLREAGYYCGDRTPAPSRDFPNNDYIGRWTARRGVNNFYAFMFNERAQDDAFNRAMQIYVNRMDRTATQFLNQVRGEVQITWGGLLAAAWEAGTGQVIAFVRSNGTQPQNADVRAAIRRRLENFQNYAIPFAATNPPADLNRPDFSRCRPPDPPPANPPPQPPDPLLLDLDGDGIETINVRAGAHFDHNGDGFTEQSGWAAPDDGLLVMDRNGDGTINDGKELFGSDTILSTGARAANGFQALAEFDRNKDGKIDATDAAFSELRVWQDFDGDGVSSPYELYTLDELGIRSINLDSTITNTTDAQGNTRTRVGSFEDTGGSTGEIAEYGLQLDTTYTFVNEWLDVPPDIAALPSLQGYGVVYDLDQAMVRDTSGQLKSLVDQFIGAADPNLRNALMQEILFKWTGSETIGPTSRGSYIDARKLGVLEKMFGRSLVSPSAPNPNYHASIALNESYRVIFETMYADLMAQTHLKDLYDKLTYTWDDEKEEVKTDFRDVIPVILTELNNDRVQAEQLLSEFARTLRGHSLCPYGCYQIFRETMLEIDPDLGWVIDSGGLPVYDAPHQGTRWTSHIEGTDNADAVKGSLTEGDGFLNGLNGNDVIYGTDRNEILINVTGDALLVAGGGNDVIWAGGNNDILDGGTGNDILYGEGGNDTYIFRRGSGQDTIVDTDATPGNVDTIWMGSFLTPDDIAVRRSGNDLVVKIIDTQDKITVQSFFDTRSVAVKAIEQIMFSDATVWDVNEILYRQSLPTEGDDYLAGDAQDDVIDALGGNDVVLGQGGNDTLTGGAGNDRLFGGDGDDVLDSATGNDELQGGSGSDTYLFHRGDGQDTIRDVLVSGSDIDTVTFVDMVPSEVMLARDGTDLRISILGSNDSIVVKESFKGQYWESEMQCPMERFTFSDGTEWNTETIRKMFLRGTEGDDSVVGFSTPDEIDGLGGDDFAYGRGGDDTLHGGTGSDFLYGEAGNDTLRGGEGTDTLLGGTGDDTVDGGAGNDTLSGGSQSSYGAFWDNANGNDTYLFGRGSGQDTVVDHDNTPGNTDTIRLADDLTPDDITLQVRAGNLELSIKGTSDKLIVQSWFWNDSPEYRIEQIEFADGTVWDVDAIKDTVLKETEGNDVIIGFSRPDPMDGAGGDDTLYGRGGDDTLRGGPGTDTLYGEAGNDTLRGGDGDDTLVGGTGEDVLDGGAGNDTLSGNGGTGYVRYGESVTSNDTYLFARGSGRDTIIDYDLTSGNLDAISLSPDLLPADVRIRREGENLLLSIHDTADTLTVTNWFMGESAAWQVEEIRFSDGTVWDVDAIKQKVLEGTDGSDVLVGYSGSDMIRGFAGNDRLYGRDGGDTLDGGAGNDYLEGGTGADTYLFGTGSGEDIIVDYDNTQGTMDTVLLSSDVQPSDITLKRGGNDLFISINGTDDRLQLTDWFSDDAHKIERLQFSDGTVWDAAYMHEMAITPTGTDDYLVGTPANDFIDGGGGNDQIHGLAGDDQLLGGDGNDSIDGGAGTNLIDGGAGDDQIITDEGQNTIKINRECGFDSITSRFIDPGEQSDTIVFGPGITPADLVVQMTIDELQVDGTVMVKDINPGSGSGEPANLTNINGTLFFRAYEGVHGWELWKSDGTEPGTVMVKDIYPSSGSSGPTYLTNVNGTLFFQADHSVHGWELWKSDGTDAGTVMVKDMYPGSSGSSPKYLTNVDGTLFFEAYDGVHGRELWKSDGTEPGTVMVRDIYPGSGSGGSYYLTDVNGTLFFKANDGSYGYELWKSDGTDAGTVMVKDTYLGSGSGVPEYLTNVNGTVFFVAYDSVHGIELWKSDGTEAGTVMVKDIYPGSGGQPYNLTNMNGTLFFTAWDGIQGSELWKSDGTEPGTVMVKDIYPGSGSGSPQYLTDVNGTLFFTASDGVHGSELWKSDGTDTGTVMVQDIYSGSGASYPRYLANANGTLFFQADDGIHGCELWKSDGTEAGTVMVQDIYPGSGSSWPRSLTNVSGNMFFMADDGVHGYELWRYGGSASGHMELTIGIGNDEGVVIRADADDGGTAFNPSDLAIKRFVFADGTVLTLQDILARANAVAGYQEGAGGDDVLLGSDTNDEIYGLDGNDTIRSADGDDAVDAGAGDDIVFAGNGNDVVEAGVGNDIIDAGDGNDIIDAGYGTDRIEAGPGDDVIFGLQGGDTAIGGSGDDTYHFNLGDGQVAIEDLAGPGAGNTIVFGEGIGPDDISLISGPDTLTLKIGDAGDEIGLKVFDPQDALGSHAVDTFLFADGTSLSYADLLLRGFDVTGTEGEDLFEGASVSDRMVGLGGDDIFLAGPGNDLVDGGSGDDTYVFNLGDGVDTIRDAAAPGAGNVVEFGIGITAVDLILSVDRNTLVINVGADGDALCLEGFNPDDPYTTVGVETFRFADGTVLSSAELLDLGFVFQGTPEADMLTGTGARDLFIGGQGNDRLAGGAGDDTYLFETGDGVDTITDESTPMEPNMLVFRAGITPDDINLSHDPTNGLFRLNLGTTGDTVMLNNFDSEEPYGPHAVEYFQFADGQVLTYSQTIDKGFDIHGTPGDDTLTGTATTDRIIGGDGNDTLGGGPGNDTLTGGSGDDTYLFNAGDGIDIIDDVATAVKGNTLVFGEGITLDDIANRLTYRDTMLIIRVGADGDEVHLTGFDRDAADAGSHAVQSFQFADGTVLDYEELVRNTFIIQGDYADDHVMGTNVTDRLYGYEGSDRLEGGLGNDTLTGGTETDELLGGAGSDLYVFNLGDGVDTIDDAAVQGEENMILFDEGITPESIVTHMEGTTLVVEYGDRGDAIRLLNYDYNAQDGSRVIGTIEFSDGARMQLSSFVDPGTEGDDVILGAYFEDVIDAKGGNDTVITFESNDTIDGGTGNDTLDAGPGDDLIAGGPGNDTLIGGEGYDTYLFNLGDGVDTITDTASLQEGNLIRFGEGITQDDIRVTVEGATLTIEYCDAGDAIRLVNFDYNAQDGSHVVETLGFADGTYVRLPSLVDPGTEGDDVILGSYFEDVINAKGGNDTVTTFESNDTIDGGTGEDTIDAGAGYDLVIGGPGNDTLSGGPGNDTYVFNVGDGVDAITDTAASGEGNTIQFGPGITADDLKLGYDGATLIVDIGTSGDQLRLNGFNREDALGPHAVESFLFADGTSITYAELIGRGFDLVGTEGDDTILGTNVDDRIQGLSGNDTIEAGIGSDLLDGGAGADMLTGGLGDDLYRVDDASDLVIENPDEGIDTVASSITYTLGENVEDLTLTGDSSIDGTGNDLDNLLTGNGADNVLDGGAGSDTMRGGGGSDTYIVDAPGDVVIEESNEGIDTVRTALSYTLGANVENLALAGTANIDGIGNELDNVLTGNSGANLLSGAAGNDTLTGGSGDDTYGVDSTGDTVIEDPDEGTDTVQSSVTYTLGANLENLMLIGLSAINGAGNAFDNVLTGNAAANTLNGGLGNDTLSGGDGDDTYVYNPGDGLDRLSDAAGQDTIFMGPGIDFQHTVIRMDTTTARLRLLDAQGNETGQGIDIALNPDGSIPVERVHFADGGSINSSSLVIESQITYGTRRNDYIRTGRDDDTIYALNGNDTVCAGLSNDTVYGGNGNDSLYGEAGNDTLYGERGNDALFGGNGNDSLYGGTGNDFLEGGSGDDRLYGGQGNDVLCGRTGNDLLEGEAGNDTLLGGDGNETLMGGTGNDTLSGGRGNDTLHGNAGNDFISGGQGDDSIIFNRGDRHDFIIPDIRDAMDRFCQDDHDRHFSGDVSDNGKDTVKFGANPLDLIFSKSCGSLNVSINGTSDRLTLAGGKHGDTSLVDVFEASDGRRLLNTQVDQLIQAMATFCSSSGMTWSQAAQQRPTEVQQVLAQFWQPQ